MAPPKKMTKVVTEKEIESGRISLPAAVRDHLFPHVAQNTKTAATMVDEKRDSYDVVLKVRDKRRKPEIMAKGGKKFAQNRKLKPGDVLLFSRGQSGDHFKVRVKRGPSLAGFSARGSQPLALIGSDDDASLVIGPPSMLGLGGPLAAGSQTSVPTFGPYLIGSDDHATVALGLGSLSAQAKPPPVALRSSLSIGSNIAPVVQPAPRTDTELRLGGFTAPSKPLASTVLAFGQYWIGSDDHASPVIGPPSMLGLGGPLAAGSQTSVPTFGPYLIGSDDHATVALGLGSLSAQAKPPPVSLRSSLSIGSNITPVVQPPPRTDTELRLGGFTARSKPLASTVPAFGQYLIGSDDHASLVVGSPPMETLVLGLGGPLAGSQTSAPAFSQSLIGSDDHAKVALGLGSLSAKAQPPPVAPGLSLSIGSDDMPVELSLSNGSNHAPPIKPTPEPPVAPPAPAIALMSSSVGRIKAEVQEVGVGVGPTLELTLGLGPTAAPTVSVSAKFVEAAEPKFKPPEGVWVAEQELQEPKPPTALTPFSGLFLSLHPPLNPRPEEEEAAVAPLAADQHACMYPFGGSGVL